MKRHVARAMLDKMLTGDVLQESDLRALMAVDNEHQHVDFKHGSLTDDRDEAKQVVRSYATGFANADGGLLVIGVSDGPPAQRRITKTKRPGGATLDSWARSCLEDFAGQLVPFPRFQVLNVEGCDVLIVATARAPAMVPCHEKGARVYHLRVGDSTKPVPDYLLSDLLLGRRAHPILEVRRSGKGGAVNGGQGSWQLGFGFEVENRGLVTASGVRIGLILWGMRPQQGQDRGAVASEHLRSFIDVVPCPDHVEGVPMAPVHLISVRDKPDVGPFDLLRVFVNELVIPQLNGEPMRSALYVVSNGHPPEFYQFDWTTPSKHGDSIESTITRALVERPVVAWNDDGRAGG
jgi:hypothetical protein